MPSGAAPLPDPGSPLVAVQDAAQGLNASPAVGASAVTTRYEAESTPAVCGGAVASNHSGFSGSGFCDTTNAVGSAVQFTIDSAAAGTATVSVRYANGSATNRPADVAVNGTTVQSGFPFEVTGVWTTWVTKSVTVQVAAGGNTVRLAATTADGLANIDFIEAVTPDGGDGGDGLVIIRGTTQGLNAPLAVDNPRPEFAWSVTSSQAGAVVTAAEVEVRDAERTAEPIWTNRAEASGVAAMTYDGPALAAKHRYTWRVRVRDAAGDWSDWGPDFRFGTGMLSDQDWNGAAWISQRDWVAGRGVPAPGGTLLGLPLLRTNFSVGKPVANASLYVSGLGAYAASVNGKPAGTIVLGSGWTKYDKVAYYDGIDVTSEVQAGQNTVGIALGQGTLNGLHTWTAAENRGAWDGILRTRALLQVTYADGTTQAVPTSTGWAAAQGPSLPFASPAVLPEKEGYDARKEQPGWNTPSFDASRWAPAVTVGNGAARLQASPIEPSRVVGEISLGSPATPAAGVFVYNVRQNISGNARITLDVPAGTAVRIRYAESLSNGRAVVAGNRPQDDTFIGKGSGAATWTPSFTHKGFQYIEVSGLPSGAPAPRVTALRIHNDIRSVGTFDSSNDVLNFVHKAGRETILNNFVLAAPTDGSYLEKLPWLGDGALMAEATMRNFDARTLYIKWYNDIADSLRGNGDLPAWAPVPTRAADLSSAAWGNAFTETATLLLRDHDAKQAVAARYGQLKAYAEFVSSQTTNPVELWGDWVCPDGDSVCNTAADKRLVARAYVYRTLDQFANVAQQLGYPGDAATFANRAAAARTAFNTDYLRSGTYRTASGARFLQTNNVLPVAFGITPEANRQAVVNAVAADVAARGDHLGTGVLGTKWLFRVLTQYGHLDTAYRAATQRTAPGYGAWMAAGATTLWEEWTTTRSKGHPFLGTAEDWMLADIAGLTQTGTNSTKVVVKPRIPANLQRASASLQTNGGTASSGWTLANGHLTLTVEVPVNRTGTIHVPVTGGQRVIAPPGAVPAGSEGAYRLYTVPSGRYVFTTANA
ncbi:family 78 glycoside hydrolase catalytic domain [Saccharothrix sp. NRRL B-16348]|uniref:family 78 glycoside hydrolase catalytic domain n=1 Tax=Saccharothrix sp. NRRL B-16348 TaxID=1415542 RepID=UPI0018D007C6|nr:family 78 glycoside hydrolase catalytic domain [Saccharothrix sp. NRRL B-16348]